jgi:hypothetical protein
VKVSELPRRILLLELKRVEECDRSVVEWLFRVKLRHFEASTVLEMPKLLLCQVLKAIYLGTGILLLGLKRVQQCDRFLGERLFPVKFPHFEASTVLQTPKLLLSPVVKVSELPRRILLLELKRVEQCDRFLGERLFRVKRPHFEASTELEMPKLLLCQVLKASYLGTGILLLGLKRVEQCDRLLLERLFPVKLPHSGASTGLETPKLLSPVLKVS